MKKKRAGPWPFYIQTSDCQRLLAVGAMLPSGLCVLENIAEIRPVERRCPPFEVYPSLKALLERNARTGTAFCWGFFEIEAKK